MDIDKLSRRVVVSRTEMQVLSAHLISNLSEYLGTDCIVLGVISLRANDLSQL